MTEPSSEVFRNWLAAARGGSQSDLGRALDACRAYLTLIAEAELGSTLRPKAGASDLVQESLLDAQKDFARFQGRTRDDLYAWIGAILRHNLADLGRRYRLAGCRAIDREQSLGDPAAAMPTRIETPSVIVSQAEEDDRLREAIGRLPPDARAVLGWRQHDRLEWAEIGLRLGKTAEAARKVWFRAVEKLRHELGGDHAA